MKRFCYAMLLAIPVSILVSVTVFAQAKPATQPAGKPTTPTPAVPATPTKFVPPIKGEAELAVAKPLTKREKDIVVTTIKVKNVSNTRTIAGLRVQEFWYDKQRQLVTGGEDRNKKPLMPGEVYTFRIETPYNPKMDTNQYVFTHANGKIKAKQVAKIE